MPRCPPTASVRPSSSPSPTSSRGPPRPPTFGGGGGGGGVGFQIHSWNDLEEWAQALCKFRGLSTDIWLKIDPHFVPPGTTTHPPHPHPQCAVELLLLLLLLLMVVAVVAVVAAAAELCATQSRVPAGDERGCLLLSHDDPTPQSQYNSTQDLLSLLQHSHFHHTTERRSLPACLPGVWVCGWT